MTYKFRITLRPQWLLESAEESAQPLQELLALLAAIDTKGNIASACHAQRVSYRHGWGVVRRFEAAFDTPLILTQRRKGSMLTPFAQRLLWANRRIEARLAPTLDSLASELQEELERLLPAARPHLRLHASHGFAVEALMQHLEKSQNSVELRYRNAIEALASLARGECDIAGFQVPQGEFEGAILADYRQWLHGCAHLLINLARRNTGFFVRAGNPKSIVGVADLARADVRFVNRQLGSSTRSLMQLLLQRAGIDIGRVQGFQTNEFTHMAIAAHIASGMADVGLGVETAARRFGLDFIPLVQERYFFAVCRDALPQPALQSFLSTLRSPAYVAGLEQLPGYDARDCGRVLSLEEAFP